MFTFRFPNLGRGAIHTSVIAIVAAAVGAVLSATITHNVTIPKAWVSHEMAPIDPSCTSSLPCIEYDNNSTGPGIRGISVSGNGLAGATKNASTSVANGRAGLIGNDTGTGTFNSGVHGLSINGTGVLGGSAGGVGVQGTSSTNNGVYGVSNAAGASGVYGFNPASGFGVAGRVAGTGGIGAFGDGGTKGIGVYGISTNFVGVNAVGGGNNGAGNTFPALSIVGNSLGDLILACPPATVNPCDSNHNVFDVVDNGDVISKGALTAYGSGFFFGGLEVGFGGNITPGYINISGEYLKDGACVAGCMAPTATSPGRAVVSYVPTQSLPTIDDFGEASLQNGSAYVGLDPGFANVINQSANYLVFITPEGDSRGLYVTQKTVRGFAVHENMGGHSSIAFSYRIVAKPLGSHEARLPMVELPKLHSGLPTQARRFHPHP